MNDPVNTGDWRDVSASDHVSVLPEVIPPAFSELIDSSEGSEALRRQIVYSPLEERVTNGELCDPLGEARYLVTPWLVHQYKNRVLLLATGRCIGYCRYCFRRSFTSRSEGFITPEQIEFLCDWLARHPDVQEILVSGGDPLSGTHDELVHLLSSIRRARSDMLIRLCTRAPVFAPQLFTVELMDFLSSMKPLWLIPHINHPDELGFGQRACLEQFINRGLPVQSQSVLLSGVNDDARVLANLFHTLVCIGVKPGYLFQCDMAPGTSHFRLPLDRSLSLYRELSSLLSGLSLPVFAVDLPGGGGKFPLSSVTRTASVVVENGRTQLRAEGSDGKVYTYSP